MRNRNQNISPEEKAARGFISKMKKVNFEGKYRIYFENRTAAVFYKNTKSLYKKYVLTGIKTEKELYLILAAKVEADIKLFEGKKNKNTERRVNR